MGSSLTEPHHIGGEIKAEGRKRLLLSFWRVPGLCPQRGTSWIRTTVCHYMDLGLRASKQGPHREGCWGPPSPKVHPETRPSISCCPLAALQHCPPAPWGAKCLIQFTSILPDSEEPETLWMVQHYIQAVETFFILFFLIKQGPP